MKKIKNFIGFALIALAIFWFGRVSVLIQKSLKTFQQIQEQGGRVVLRRKIDNGGHARVLVEPAQSARELGSVERRTGRGQQHQLALAQARQRAHPWQLDDYGRTRTSHALSSAERGGSLSRY